MASRLKAVRTVAVLDVLSQLFLDREFFQSLANELNCYLRIDESVMREAISSGYRYNAFPFK